MGTLLILSNSIKPRSVICSLISSSRSACFVIFGNFAYKNRIYCLNHLQKPTKWQLFRTDCYLANVEMYLFLESKNEATRHHRHFFCLLVFLIVWRHYWISQHVFSYILHILLAFILKCLMVPFLFFSHLKHHSMGHLERIWKVDTVTSISLLA